MKKLKILFWIINYPNSIGEITNACLFAGEIRNENDIYFYCTSALAASYISHFKFRNISVQELADTDFDLIIFSEYYTLFSGNGANQELNIATEFIRKKHIPVLSLDALGLGSSNREIKLAFAANKKLERYYKHIKLPEQPFYSVQPCPLNNPLKAMEKSTYSWLLPVFRKSNPAVFFNTEPEEFNVLLPVSKWQHRHWEKKYPTVNIIENLKEYFIKTLSEQTFSKKINFFIGVPEPKYRKVSYHNFNLYTFDPESSTYLKPDLYESLIGSMDLVITVSLLQNSFIRAVASGITGINLTHNVFAIHNRLNCPEALNEVKLNSTYLPGLYPFDSKNPFLQRFTTFELTDPALIKFIIDFEKYSTEKNSNFYNDYRNICYTAKDIIFDIRYAAQ